jgi:hypothetical protein
MLLPILFLVLPDSLPGWFGRGEPLEGKGDLSRDLQVKERQTDCDAAKGHPFGRSYVVPTHSGQIDEYQEHQHD